MITSITIALIYHMPAIVRTSQVNLTIHLLIWSFVKSLMFSNEKLCPQGPPEAALIYCSSQQSHYMD